MVSDVVVPVVAVVVAPSLASPCHVPAPVAAGVGATATELPVVVVAAAAAEVSGRREPLVAVEVLAPLLLPPPLPLLGAPSEERCQAPST